MVKLERNILRALRSQCVLILIEIYFFYFSLIENDLVVFSLDSQIIHVYSMSYNKRQVLNKRHPLINATPLTLRSI